MRFDFYQYNPTRLVFDNEVHEVSMGSVVGLTDVGDDQLFGHPLFYVQILITPFHNMSFPTRTVDDIVHIPSILGWVLGFVSSLIGLHVAIVPCGSFYHLPGR